MRYLPILVLMVFILSVTGCGKKNEIPTADECNKYLDRRLRSECIYNMSFGNRNPAYCKDIPDLQIRYKCVTDISINLSQDAYCGQIDKLSAKEDCEQKVADAMKARKAKPSN
jgi:hypothetical protein